MASAISYTAGSGNGAGLTVGTAGQTGTVVFANTAATTYSGPTTLSYGTLKGGARNAFSANSLIADGSTLDLGGFDQAIGGLSGGSAGVVTNSGPTAATLTTAGLNGSTFAGTIENGMPGSATGLTKVGTGTQVLTGTNTYTGVTTISGGTLQLGSGGTTGSIADTSGITDNGTLAVNRSDVFTLGTALSGSGALNQIGTGTLVLSGANTYSGGTTLDAGTLELAAQGAAGQTAQNSQIAGGVAFGAVGTTLKIDGAAFSGNTYAAPVTNFASGRTLDLSGFAYLSGSTTASLGGSTLTVTNGFQTVSVTNFTLGAGLTAGYYTLVTSHDANVTSGPGFTVTGTDITLTLNAPSAPSLAAGQDTGTSSTDRLTDINTPTFTGTGADPNSTITLYDGNGTTAIGSGTSDANGNYTAKVTTALADGQHDITATVTDAGNDVSARSTATTITVDTVAPTVAITSQGGLTNQPMQTVAGTVDKADAGTTVSVYDNGRATALGTGVVQQDGSWTAPVTLAQGSNALVAKDTDAAGNTGTSNTVTYTLDTTLSTPTIAFAASNSAVGAADVNAAHAAAAAYTVGSVDSDATATVTFTGTLKSTGATGTVAGSGANGNHTVDLSGFRDGTVTASISDADTAGNMRTGTSAQATLDTTPPTITTLADSGPGIDANGNGDLNAGKTVTLIVTTSEPVYVQGGTPTLTLNDGGVATYTGGSSTNALTFTTTVAAGQNTAALAVSSVNANGAAVTDQAGNPISTSLTGASMPSGTLIVDTTPPVASSVTDTAAQNAGPTPIGLAAPSDNLTPAGSLTIAASTLPSDGIVTLSDGTTPVTAGQALTSAQLTGLEFTPTPGVSNQGSTFTYTVTDGAGNASTGTAALNVGSPGAPTITGTHATATTSEAAVTPFSGVTVADPSAATETLTIALTGAGGMLAGAGLMPGANGTYVLTGSAGAVTTQLDALRFTPNAGAAGTTSTTTFVLTDASSAGTSVTDAGTSVADIDPARIPVAPGSGGVVGVTPADAVSLSPQVTYKDGVFTLTGTASSAAGVSNVEITATVGGRVRDLGPATLNADGTFTFQDAAGQRPQGFITATETDGMGVTTSAQADYSLTGGLSVGQYTARETSYTADGSAVLSRSLFRDSGQRAVDVEQVGQTLQSAFKDHWNNHGAPESTFVFTPGYGQDVVNLFRVDGSDHDSLSFKGSDFGTDPASQFAAVLANTQDARGGVVITDPTTKETVQLLGISAAKLTQNQGDFTFHA